MDLYSNLNVKAILFAGFFWSIGNSILWFSPIWLIYGLGGNNSDLGRILGYATLISLVLSVIGSYIADRHRRDIIIWIGLLSGLIGTYFISRSLNLNEVLFGQIVAASGFALIGPAIIGLFSNSIPANNRNKVFGTQFMINTGSSAIGNIIIYFLFLDVGSSIQTLDLSTVRTSLIIAMGFMAVAFSISLFARDKNALTEEEEGTIATTFTRTKEPILGKSSRTSLVKSSFAPGAIPIISFTIFSGIFIGFGAGISIPYFPRFFFDIYRLDLSQLSLVFAGLTILTGIWGKINSNLADSLGRVELIVMNQSAAVVLLYILALYPPLILALITLFVRNAAMNGAWPLSNAIQMEYAPRSYRSKITAATQVSWAAMFGIGQILGGILVDTFGFSLPFAITASLYLIATVLYWRIKTYMPEKRDPS